MPCENNRVIMSIIIDPSDLDIWIMDLLYAAAGRGCVLRAACGFRTRLTAYGHGLQARRHGSPAAQI